MGESGWISLRRLFNGSNGVRWSSSISRQVLCIQQRGFAGLDVQGDADD
jgi:hypothetical protein